MVSWRIDMPALMVVVFIGGQLTAAAATVAARAPIRPVMVGARSPTRSVAADGGRLLTVWGYPKSRAAVAVGWGL